MNKSLVILTLLLFVIFYGCTDRKAMPLTEITNENRQLYGNIDNIKELAVSYQDNDDPGDTAYIFQNFYNEQNRIIKTSRTIFFEGSQAISFVVYSYNKSGQLVETDYYDSDSNLSSFITAEWKKGALVKETQFDGYGRSTGYTLHFYDDNHHVKSVNYTADGQKISSVIYDWNDGKVIASTVLRDDERTEYSVKIDYRSEKEVVYLYTDDIFEENGLYPIEVKTLLTPEGLFSRHTTTTSNSTIEEYFFQYEFDSEGNWINKKQFYSDSKRPARVTTREIIYRK